MQHLTTHRGPRTATTHLATTLLVLAAAIWLGAPAAAQQAGPPQPADPAANGPAENTPPPQPGPEDEFERGVPRTAVEGYLSAAREGDFARAAQYLDLSRIAEDRRGQHGQALARELKIVLDRQLWVDLDSISLDRRGDRDDGLPASRDRIGVIEGREGSVEIELARVRRADGQSIWKFSRETVAAVPELYDEFGVGEIGKLFPASLYRVALFDLQHWQWLALLVLIPTAALLSWLLAWLLLQVLSPLARLSDTDFDDRIMHLAIAPVRIAIGIGIFAAGFRPLGLAIPAHEFLRGVTRALAIVALLWLLLRLVDMAAEILRGRLVARGQAAAVGLVPPGRKTVKAMMIAIGVVAMLDNFGFDVTALVAGLGVGGLAVALAAQKTLENLFGGLTLYADRPVRVGDFCRFGDRVGTIEEIGLRSTRVRTLDRTLVSVPNAEFSTMQLENFASRDRIWFHPTIGLRYETTPDQLRYVLVEIRKLFYSHPRVDPDPARVRFESFGDFSLNLGVFTYVRTSDWNEYLEIAEDLNLRIMDIVEASGSGFAFPSSTTYLAQDSEPDAAKRDAAEAQVRAWREQNELHLPGFPGDTIAELRGSLPWPPEGASRG